MMIRVPDLLSPDEVARVRGVIDAGEWVDGNVTSGAQSALAKHNEQVVEGSPAHAQAGAMILDALALILVCRGGTAAQGVSAALQSLRGRAGVRDACRQCDPHPAGERLPHPIRSLHDGVPGRSGRL